MKNEATEQTKSKKGHQVESEIAIGNIKIADDVVAAIAALAACEVEGVAGMAGMNSDLLTKVGVKASTKGARVEINGSKVKVALAVIVEYGYNIPSTCQYIQTKVKNTVENMTSLEVCDVNIRIAGVNVNK